MLWWIQRNSWHHCFWINFYFVLMWLNQHLWRKKVICSFKIRKKTYDWNSQARIFNKSQYDLVLVADTLWLCPTSAESADLPANCLLVCPLQCKVSKLNLCPAALSYLSSRLSIECVCVCANMLVCVCARIYFVLNVQKKNVTCDSERVELFKSATRSLFFLAVLLVRCQRNIDSWRDGSDGCWGVAGQLSGSHTCVCDCALHYSILFMLLLVQPHVLMKHMSQFVSNLLRSFCTTNHFVRSFCWFCFKISKRQRIDSCHPPLIHPHPPSSSLEASP